MENLYETTVERYRKYVMPTYAPKILFVRGQGARRWDADGREYLDFAAGISVCPGAATLSSCPAPSYTP